MKQLSITFLLAVLMGMIGAKAYAHIEVKNADGVTIYYNWINNSTELEVTGVYYGYYYDCGDDHYDIVDTVLFISLKEKRTIKNQD